MNTNNQNNWFAITQQLHTVSAESLKAMNQQELAKLEVLLHHWHKLTRGALDARRQDQPNT